MAFRINDGPLAGQEGDKVQSRVIRERLLKEAERNIAIHISENDDKDSFHGGGAWRVAARDPDREHAPRRLRADGLAPPRPVQDRRDDRRAPRADRGDHHRRRRGALRRRRAEAVGAQGRAHGDASLGRRAPASGVPRADARATGLPERIADRHARHCRHEPSLPCLRAVPRRDPRPAHGRPDLQRRRRGRRLRALQSAGPRTLHDRSADARLSQA